MRDLERGGGLSREACLELIAGSKIGRLILTENALPTAVTVPYAVDGTDIVFRTGADTRLATNRAGTVVAFQIDAFDETRDTGWSVTVTGLATVISDPEQENRALSLGIRIWGQPHDFRYIRLTPTIIRGETITVQPVEP